MCKFKIAKRLKKIFDDRDIKKINLAKKIGVSTSIVSRWINVTSPSSMNVIHFKLLCDELSIDPEWLLTGNTGSNDDFVLQCYRSCNKQIEFQYRLRGQPIIL